MSVYLDCNATSPIEPRVSEVMRLFFDIECGNAGSRTHDFGARAKVAVQNARAQVAAVVGVDRDEVIFTSGATESNNLALLGLATALERAGRKHIITTQIEHKAVLEPLEYLGGHGFDVTVLPPAEGGYVDPDAVKQALRTDTGLVSVMHVNNETGVLQPIREIAAVLGEHPAFFHVDAAQGFGKVIADLQNKRIDFMSVSAHKIYGPKGVGALITRRRGFDKVPLTPLMYGGGQERGLRPGTLPVPLIAGLGMASELAIKECTARAKRCAAIREQALAALLPLGATINGKPERTLPHVLNLSFPGLDAEAVMLALKDLIAISSGSACTSSSYQPSHVLKAMGFPMPRINGALRLSWCHMTGSVDWVAVKEGIASLRG